MKGDEKWGIEVVSTPFLTASGWGAQAKTEFRSSNVYAGITMDGRRVTAKEFEDEVAKGNDVQ